MTEGHSFLRFLFLSVFSHENENAPATGLYYLMYRDGRVK
jgi:hypothetical protein